MSKINLAEKLGRFSGYWQPKIIGEFEDYEIRVAKIEGDFIWHKHDDTDELFYVVTGRLTMAFRDRVEQLDAGEMIIVPKGVEHKPSADAECHILMLEKKGTPNTGDEVNERTVSDLERI